MNPGDISNELRTGTFLTSFDMPGLLPCNVALPSPTLRAPVSGGRFRWRTAAYGGRVGGSSLSLPAPRTRFRSFTAWTRDAQLYQVDGATGVATLVGVFAGASNMNEIEIDPLTGNAYVLYGALADVIRQVDLATATFIGSPVALSQNFSGLEFVNGTLYGAGPTVAGLDFMSLIRRQAARHPSRIPVRYARAALPTTERFTHPTR